MHRLPFALALAAVIALTIVVKVHYEFPATSAAVLRATYMGGAGQYYVTIEYNTTLPPPVIIIATSNGTAVVKYDTSVTSKLGAAYLGDSNGTAVRYSMVNAPRGTGVDSITVYIETTMDTVLWVSTDGKTWAPVQSSGYALS